MCCGVVDVLAPAYLLLLWYAWNLWQLSRQSFICYAFLLFRKEINHRWEQARSSIRKKGKRFQYTKTRHWFGQTPKNSRTLMFELEFFFMAPLHCCVRYLDLEYQDEIFKNILLKYGSKVSGWNWFWTYISSPWIFWGWIFSFSSYSTNLL